MVVFSIYFFTLLFLCLFVFYLFCLFQHIFLSRIQNTLQSYCSTISFYLAQTLLNRKRLSYIAMAILIIEHIIHGNFFKKVILYLNLVFIVFHVTNFWRGHVVGEVCFVYKLVQNNHMVYCKRNTFLLNLTFVERYHYTSAIYLYQTFRQNISSQLF